MRYGDSASSWGNKYFYVLQMNYSIIVKNKANLSGRNSSIILLLFAEVLRYVIWWMAWDNCKSRAIDFKTYLKDSSHLILFLVRLMFYKVGLTKMLYEIIFLVNQSLQFNCLQGLHRSLYKTKKDSVKSTHKFTHVGEKNNKNIFPIYLYLNNRVRVWICWIHCNWSNLSWVAPLFLLQSRKH